MEYNQNGLGSEQNAIDIIGRSCRLPGARNTSELWELLKAGRCSVSQVGPERFSMFRYAHSRRGEPGKSYSFAAGLIDDVWGFDPAFFAISPREAAQMDPQQRLLLMLVHEALEDAGLTSRSMSSCRVGVYVGNSGVDHNNRFFFDPAGTDPYMMTGNTGALVSNRISYVFDFHGPSQTIDTACSSSLVALNEAVNALRLDRIDLAVVAGVSLILSPFPFVGFSAASMLSPQGLCRSFDRQADGYVRGEGGVVLVLSRANAMKDVRVHARIVATGVNCDGRTMGVALPSAEGQARLLEEVYAQAGIDIDRLAFVEAHGTGTRVGDPVEAGALGKVLGQAREKPLPIGSIKSNIGHLEPASGLAGLLKAMLALENNLLPASLHVDEPNPDIPFEELNLEINTKARRLPKGNEPRLAGVSNFGFGGVNAHVILSDPPAKGTKDASKDKVESAGMIMLSAASQGALRDLARQYGGLAGRDREEASLFADVAAAAYWRREHMAERLVVFGRDEEEIASGLREWADAGEAANAVTARAGGKALKVALVYSGNGCQFAGMGRAAFERNEDFAASFRKIDALFGELAGWSLREALFADDLAEQLKSTRIAQPLLFAVQAALTDVLRQMGLQISGVLGHSVGEVAAALACGALPLEQAARVIHERSEHQESLRGQGGMAAVMAPPGEVEDLLAGDPFLSSLAISAINSPRSLTVSGPKEETEHFVALAGRRGWPHKLLELDYPFHTPLVDPIRDDLVTALASLRPGRSSIPYYSTVTGRRMAGSRLGGEYWWNNVRQRVEFSQAVQSAAMDGCRLFVEIGPRPVLQGYLGEIFRTDEKIRKLEGQCANIASLDEKDDRFADPVRAVFARAVASGASFDEVRLFGPQDGAPHVALPLYPWQTRPYKIEPSREAIEGVVLRRPPHPLLGQQLQAGTYVWDAHLDISRLPFLEEHKVDGKVVLPAAAFAEMALEAGRQWLGDKSLELRDMDIFQALLLFDDHVTSIRTRLDVESGAVEIRSRKRLSDDNWRLHVRCRVRKGVGEPDPYFSPPALQPGEKPEAIARLYRLARLHGIDFGPRFRRMIRCDEVGEDGVEVVLNERDSSVDPADGETCGYNLHPLDLDACFHGLNVLYDRLDLGNDRLPFLPVRMGELRLCRPGADVRTCRIDIRRANRRGGQGDLEMFDEQGNLVAVLRDVRFRAAALVPRHTLAKSCYAFTHKLMPLPGERDKPVAPALPPIPSSPASSDDQKLEEQRLILEAASARMAYDLLAGLCDNDGGLDLSALEHRERTDHGKGGEDEDGARRRLAIVSALLAIAGQAVLAEPVGSGEEEKWRLSRTCQLPSAHKIMTGLLAEEPRWLAECVLLNRAGRVLAGILGPVKVNKGSDPAPKAEKANGALQYHEIYSPAMLEHLAASSPLAEAHIARIDELAGNIIDNWPADRPLRVLELGVGGGGLTRRLLPRIAARRGLLVSADTSSQILARLQVAFASSPYLETVRLTGEMDGLAQMGPFDLLVSANGLHMLDNCNQTIAEVSAMLAGGALAFFSESGPDAFHDLVFSPAKGWLDSTMAPLFPLNSLKTRDEWQTFLQGCGFENVNSAPLSPELENAHIVMAIRAAGGGAGLEDGLAPVNGLVEAGRQAAADENPVLLVMAAADERLEELAVDISRQLATAGEGEAGNGKRIRTLCLSASEKLNGSLPGGRNEQLENAVNERRPFEIIFLAGGREDEGLGEAAGELGSQLETLAGLLQTVAGGRGRLWMVVPGGARHMAGAGRVSPVNAGLWAWGRTAMNEYPNLDIRLVDFSADLDREQWPQRLAALLRNPGEESELVLGREGAMALRACRLPLELAQDRGKSRREAARQGEKILLQQPSGGALEQLQWARAQRRSPRGDEVEIEIAATGLNYRDVMWAQGLLPEEALEDGFAGPTLGFECSGRVVATGPDVRGLTQGDAVMALAPACFASHVTVSQKAVARLPEGIDLEAAASIPVAFLTAHYALNHLGHLREDEWVLIHGGAGGVGLAAIQLAKLRRARIIATAGNAEKRAFLKMMGAEYVFDSRSLDFASKIRDVTEDGQGSGVDMVLNSLAGESMERSLELLRPFGRFMELGKRDFYGNTKIGLRPLRKNISYFGIDADELLSRQPKLSRELLEELSRFFETGRLAPLPCRMFDSGEVSRAFRLMQRSGHIGKILVRAPRLGEVALSAGEKRFSAAQDGVHVITGGLGGFGMEAASWLADHGARHIVLTSRRGVPDERGRKVIERLRREGVEIEAVACDVSDDKALGELLARLRRKRPLRGIMHAAAVIDDHLIKDLTAEQIDRVLRPKVAGAVHLDRLTQTDALDYFVLFSSATVMFGNPGQAHYVAANAFLDALAGARRQNGRPALAIGWGAITDAGILARDRKTAKSLARHTGGIDFSARDALDLLGQLLMMDEDRTRPAMALAAMNWSVAGTVLPIMAKPVFGTLVREAGSGGGGGLADLGDLIRGLDDAEALAEITTRLVGQIAPILRMPVEDIDPARPLKDLGMESLMGMELYMAIGQNLGVELPDLAIGETTTAADLAARILAILRDGEKGGQRPRIAGEMLASRHMTEQLDEQNLDRLSRKVQYEMAGGGQDGE